MEEFYKICKAHEDLRRINEDVIAAKINLDEIFAQYTPERMVGTIKMLLSKLPPSAERVNVARLNSEKNELKKMTIEKVLKWCRYNDLMQIAKLLLSGESVTGKYSNALSLLRRYADHFLIESTGKTKYELNDAITSGDIAAVERIMKTKNCWAVFNAKDAIDLVIMEHQNSILALFLELAKAESNISKYVTGNKILKVAIACKNYGAVRALSNVTLELDYDSCIIFAIKNDNCEVVKLLVNKLQQAVSAAPVAPPPPCACAPVRMGSKVVKKHPAKKCAKKKPQVQIRSPDNKRFLKEAARGNNNEIIRIFLDHTRVDASLMKQLVRNNNASMIQELFREYPKESQEMLDSDDVTKLFTAIASNDQPNIINLFIERMNSMPIAVVNCLIKNNFADLLNVVVQKFPDCIATMLSQMKRCHIRDTMVEILSQEYTQREHIIPSLLNNGLKMMPYLIILFIKFGHCKLLSDTLTSYPCPKKIILECTRYFSFDDAVYVAAKASHIDMLKLLLDYDVKFNDNVLAYLIYAGNVEIIEMILKKFPNTVINDATKTMIIRIGNHDIIRLFTTSSNSGREFLLEAISHTQPDIVAILMEQGCNVDEDIFYSNIFSKAIKEIFELPNEPRIKFGDHEGKTTLYTAKGIPYSRRTKLEDSEDEDDCSRSESEEYYSEEAPRKGSKSCKMPAPITLFKIKMAEIVGGRRTVSSESESDDEDMDAESGRDDMDAESDSDAYANKIFRSVVNEWMDDFDYYDQNKIMCEKDFQYKPPCTKSAPGNTRKIRFMRITHLLLENGADIKYLPSAFLKKFSKYVSSDKKDFAEALFSLLDRDDYGKMFGDKQLERLNMIPMKSAANV